MLVKAIEGSEAIGRPQDVLHHDFGAQPPPPQKFSSLGRREGARERMADRRFPGKFVRVYPGTGGHLVVKCGVDAVEKPFSSPVSGKKMAQV